MRTANPALRADTFSGANALADESGTTMTLQGVVNRTVLLLILLVGSGAFTWAMTMKATSMMAITPWIVGGMLGGLVFALVTSFKRDWAPVTAPLYALAEGLFLGAVSAILEQKYPGIAVQAVGLTLAVLFTMLLLYTTRIIKPTQRLMMGIAAATSGVFLIYLVSFLLNIFGVSMPYIHGSGPIGIGFSLLVIVIAAFNLVVDFAFIERGAKEGAPKKMEWYAAFALLVTLVWLYFEILRLLAKLKER